MSEKPEHKLKKKLSDRILDFDDEQTEIVTIPEWGNAKVLCKNMTGSERATVGAMIEIDGKTKKIKTKATSADFVIMGCYDPETGEKLFSPVAKERLLRKNSAALERLASVVQRLSGMGEEEEVIEKN